MEFHMPRTKLILTVSFAAITLGLAGGVSAAGYPEKPVTVVVPFAPGGSVDTVGRLVAQALGDDLGGQFIVENRPGAAGNIGYADVARADADGYTLLLGYSSTSTCNPAMFASLNWDAEKSFAPVGIVTAAPMVLAINPALPAKDLQEFVAYGKAHKGELNYGSSGVGSQAHMGALIFDQRVGIDAAHAPYKGSGDLIPDLMSGVIDFAFGLPASFQQQAKAGALRILASTGRERDPTMPDVPVMAEVGVDNLINEGWHGLFAPAGTPPDVLAKLEASLAKITSDNAFVDKAFAAGNVIRFTNAADTAARVASEGKACAAVVESAGLKLE